jgi:hypothetical protein
LFLLLCDRISNIVRIFGQTTYLKFIDTAVLFTRKRVSWPRGIDPVVIMLWPASDLSFDLRRDSLGCTDFALFSSRAA